MPSLSAPPLAVMAPVPDRKGPQAARSVPIRWTAEASGGVGTRAYVFSLSDGTEEIEVQRGSAAEWEWRPTEAGRYRVKAVATDSLGNRAESGWSKEYEVVPPLRVEPPVPDRKGPQAAETVAIRWKASGAGGVGALSYEWRIFGGKKESLVLESVLPELEWLPKEAGRYRVRVAVRDALGNVALGESPSEYEIVPKPAVSSPVPDRLPPQAAKTVPIRWKADASGGVGPLTYVFWSTDGSAVNGEQKGPSPEWEWRPDAAGRYRVKAVVTDMLGNRAESGWSEVYEVAPPLAVTALVPDRMAPQAARTVPVRWTTASSGGVGALRYSFWIFDGSEVRGGQESPAPEWAWRPETAGRFRIKAVAVDSLGNRAESGWSREYEVALPLKVGLPAPDRKGPQAAQTGPIRWKADASGGVGPSAYAFLLSNGVTEVEVQKGPAPEWEWRPETAGRYRVKAVMTDALGNRAETDWSEEYEVALPLKVGSPAPDRKGPQAAQTVPIRWKADASGGVGPPAYAFLLSDGVTEVEVQKGPAPEWVWRPETAGRYRVRAVMTDALGNRAESAWSEEYEVALPLNVGSPAPDRKSPQVARTVTVNWTTRASGGVGSPVYRFVLFNGQMETEVQKGSSLVWDWRPTEAGRYRVKAVVTDTLGNRAESGWSVEYEVAASIGRQARIAVFPMENLSGSAAPSREIMEELKKRLTARKINVLDNRTLETFMAKHRVRYTGGLTRELGRAFRTELEVDAVLIASLGQYDDSVPPKIEIMARLVSTEEETTILWVEDVSLSGDQNPGLLGLGLVTDPGALTATALGKLVTSVDGYLSATGAGRPRGETDMRGVGAGHRSRYSPRGSFRKPELPVARGDKPAKVAVLPFLDRSARPYAGELLARQFLMAFAESGHVDVIEPGAARQALLQSRLIMEGGLSFPQADLLRELLAVDYVLCGEVMDYQDSRGPGGAPYVEFSAYVIDADRRQMVWASSSYNRGDERVVFFDWGKTHTAGALVSEMVREVTGLYLRGDAVTGSTGGFAADPGPGVP